MKNYLSNIYYALVTILIGMRITMRQFFRPGITIQYPKERMEMPPGTRNRLFCDIDDCTGCLACARICPVDCIEIGTSKRDQQEMVFTSTGVRLKLDVPKFNINMALCCYCNLCTEVCPTECLKMTPAYEFAVFDRGDLVYRFDRPTLVNQGLLPPQRPDFQPPPKPTSKPAEAAEEKPTEEPQS